MVDSYIYFIDKVIQLTKPQAPIGFIIPSTILNQVEAKAVRELLLARGLSSLVSLGQNVFGAKVLNTSTIFISGNSDDGFKLDNLSELPLRERKLALKKVKTADWVGWASLVRRDPHRTFFIGNANESALLDKLRGIFAPLSQVLQGTIQRGVSPDVVAAHVISVEEAEAEKLEVELLRPSISGTQIKRYHQWRSDQYIIYTSRNTPIDRFPRVAAHLEKFKHQNTCKEVTQGKHPWWSLHRPRDPQIFVSPKFIGLTTSKTIELVYDAEASLFVTDAMYVFSLLQGQNPWACMAILQSKAFLFLYRVANQGESRVIPQVKASKLLTLPYPSNEDAEPALQELGKYCLDMMGLYERLPGVKTAHEKAVMQRQLDALDKSVNASVYKLYSLTEEEVSLIEDSL